MFHIIQNVLYIDYYGTFYLQTFSCGVVVGSYDLVLCFHATHFILNGCKDTNLFGIILI